MEGELLKATKRVEQLLSIINPHGDRDDLIVAIADLLVKYVRWQLRRNASSLTKP